MKGDQAKIRAGGRGPADMLMMGCARKKKIKIQGVITIFYLGIMIVLFSFQASGQSVDDYANSDTIIPILQFSETYPDISMVYFKSGNANLKKAKYEEAIADFTKAIDLNPANPDYFNNRGDAYFKIWKFEFAEADFKNAIEISPNYALAHRNLGLTYSRIVEYDKAIIEFNKAIEIYPNYAEAYYNRGYVFFTVSEYDKAIADYTKAIEIYPNYYIAHLQLGNTHFWKKEYDKAISVYFKAIELYSFDINAYCNLSDSFLQKGDHPNAWKFLKKATKLNPENSKCILMRAKILSSEGKQIRSRRNYRKAFRLSQRKLKNTQTTTGR
jgi:tetratricopeptide (TPR) repeat protein